MALSTQVFLLCLCSLVADSYFFVYNGRESFNIFPGAFENHPPFNFFKQPLKNQPFTTAYVTTQKIKELLDPVTAKTTTESPTVDTIEEVESVEETLREKVTDEDNFLMNNVKVNEPMNLSKENDSGEVNTLSIHEDKVKPVPIHSVTMDEDEKNAEEVEIKIEPMSDMITTTTTESTGLELNIMQTNSTDPGLTKNSDFLIIPVNAINPSANVPLNTPTAIIPMTNMDSPYNQGTYPSNQNIPYGNNMNGVMNQGYPQGYGPVQYTNTMPSMNNYPNQMSNNPNLYTSANIPNNYQGPNGPNNLYYVQNNPNLMNNRYPLQNPPQLFQLVPLQNVPNNGINLNNFVPFNKQPNNFVPYYNQGNNFVPSQPYVAPPVNNNFGYNKPNNFIPINSNNPNNFIPVNNNQPNNNYIPINNGQSFVPQNYVPTNNQPNYFNPMTNAQNVPNNYVPINNRYFIPINNNQPNNFIPANNGPDNYGNSYPNSFDAANNNFNNNNNNYNPTNNNNFIPTNNNQPNNYGPVPADNAGYNYAPFNNGQTNFLPFNEATNVSSNTNSAVVVPVQPVGTLLTFKEEEQKKDVVASQ